MVGSDEILIVIMNKAWQSFACIFDLQMEITSQARNDLSELNRCFNAPIIHQA